MPTSPDRELKEQERWRPRAAYAHVDWFERMVHGEFLSRRARDEAAMGMLRQLLEHAVAHTPHYRELFGRLGLAPGDLRTVEDLARLPVLSRAEVQSEAAHLKAERLPPGQQPGNDTLTSGSTGRPVRFSHTIQSLSMFGLLAQRQMRWWRWEPMSRYAQIRPPQELPLLPAERRAIGKGETVQIDRWPFVGNYFATGPFFGYAHYNDLDDQLRWLDETQPHYLLSQSANLEYLALGCAGRRAPGGLKACVAVSQQLTPAMRKVVERGLGVPVFQNYGLNEVGMVAGWCPEGQRFHVHWEHCLVEIVDEEGRACRPGEAGRLLVSALRNPAMPLLRYDSGDLATAIDGTCPCGRSLPSFGAIEGRSRRIACLPPGSWRYWVAIQETLAYMPAELSAPLRQYQLRQSLDNTWELRLAVAAPLAPEFRARVQGAWRAAAGGEPAPFRISEVEEIPRGTRRKFDNFVSDFIEREEGRLKDEQKSKNGD